jgi:hypothetical protein
MARQNDALARHLAEAREITITVTGRKSGRAISLPVWFVLEGNRLYLLPVQGSDTQWYKNVLTDDSIQIAANGAKGEFKTIEVTDKKQVSAVAEKFRGKYGAADVKKYYSKFDVALVVEIG